MVVDYSLFVDDEMADPCHRFLAALSRDKFNADVKIYVAGGKIPLVDIHFHGSSVASNRKLLEGVLGRNFPKDNLAFNWTPEGLDARLYLDVDKGRCLTAFVQSDYANYRLL